MRRIIILALFLTSFSANATGYQLNNEDCHGYAAGYVRFLIANAQANGQVLNPLTIAAHYAIQYSTCIDEQ